MNNTLNLLDADTIAQQNAAAAALDAARDALDAARSEFLNLRAGAISDWGLNIMDALDALIEAVNGVVTASTENEVQG